MSIGALGSPRALWTLAHPTLLLEMPLWASPLSLTVNVASRSLCGDTLWVCTAGHPAHSPAALGLLPLQHLGSSALMTWRKGGGPGQGEGVRTGCDGADPRALAFKGQQFPFTLSGRSEIPCGEVEEGEFQHMEEVLTLIWREGKLGRGPLGRRGKLQEGRIREHLAGTQLCFSLRVCAGRCRAPEHPSLARPCCYAAQKPLSLLFPVLSAVSRVWV